MHLVLAGGGTSGHVTPNIALIEDLKAMHPNLIITYIGSGSPLETELLKDQPVSYVKIMCGKFRRYFSFANLIDFFKIPIGIIQSFGILSMLKKPKVVFSKGGYASVPVVVAAWMKRIPVVIHESDAIPGLATRILKKFSTEFWSQYPIDGAKLVQMPIRKFLYKGNKTKVKFLNTKPILLVMGGSQGATTINEFIWNNLGALLELFDIIHVTGAGKLDPVSKAGYIATEFAFDELADYYAAATIVLCRAGASTLAELSALNKFAILVPLPTKSSRGEQYANASAHVSVYGGTVIEEHELSVEKINSSAGAAATTNPKSSTLPQAAALLSAYLRV